MAGPFVKPYLLDECVHINFARRQDFEKDRLEDQDIDECRLILSWSDQP
jgi:hypothetical protein